MKKFKVSFTKVIHKYYECEINAESSELIYLYDDIFSDSNYLCEEHYETIIEEIKEVE